MFGEEIMSEDITELTDEDIIASFTIPTCALPDEFAFILVQKPTALEKRMMHIEKFREMIRETTGL